MDFKLLINGDLVDGEGAIPVVNPATGDIFAYCPTADAAQLDAAVAAAKASFPSWSASSIDVRREMIQSIAGAIEANAEQFAALLTSEQGKPTDQAMFEVMGAAYILRAFAGMDLSPRILRDDGTAKVIELRRPLGVVAAITPWNFPLLLLMNKIGPALLAGNCIVAKPAPTTPLTTLLFAKICAPILPPGVLNVICDDNDLGEQLTSHPDIAKVSFTGSTATGRKIMQAGATSLKRLTLELGGNDAAIILDDADLTTTAAQIFQGAMINAGQVCVAVKRVYVPAAMYDPFCAELARLACAAIVDAGTVAGVQIGPVQNIAQFEKLKILLHECQTTGTIIAGGHPLERPGYFIAPTIVRDVPDDARIVREEQFGPILPVLQYDDLNDAIVRINACEFGLAGSVWGHDLERAMHVAERFASGTIWVNQHMAMDPSVPFRGTKQSGIGTELGQEGLWEYTQPMIVNALKAHSVEHAEG